MQLRCLVASARGSYRPSSSGGHSRGIARVCIVLGVSEQLIRSYPILGTSFVRLSQPCRVSPFQLKKFGYKIVGFQWRYHIPAVFADLSRCRSPHAPPPFLLKPLHLGHYPFHFHVSWIFYPRFLKEPLPVASLWASGLHINSKLSTHS